MNLEIRDDCYQFDPRVISGEQVLGVMRDSGASFEAMRLFAIRGDVKEDVFYAIIRKDDNELIDD